MKYEIKYCNILLLNTIQFVVSNLIYNMSVLHNFLYQYYSIFFGHTYIFIDFKNGVLKFYLFLKIYIYLVNLLYALIIIYFLSCLIDEIMQFAAEDEMTKFTVIIFNVTRLGILIGLIVVRLKEEMVYKKWYNTYETFLDKFIFNTTLNKTTEIIQILNILVIFVCGIYYIYKIIDSLLANYTFKNVNANVVDIFTIVEMFIMFHHNFILNYMAKGFSKLNNHLKTAQELTTFPMVYLKLSKLLEQVNILNGPLIFLVLFAQLIDIAIYIRTMFQFLPVINTLPFVNILSIPMLFIISANFILYFVLCDRLYRTTKETGEILKEYNAEQFNSEVGIFNLIFSTN